MKYLQSYENHKTKPIKGQPIKGQPIRESLGIPGGEKSTFGSFVGNVLKLPLAIIGLGITQLFNGRTIDAAVSQKYLQIYTNLDVVKESVKNMVEKFDLTDTEKRKAIKTLEQIDRLLEKYPTLEDYKKLLKKVVPLQNLKNKSYLKKKIDEFEESPLDVEHLEKILKSISKEVPSTKLAFDQTKKGRIKKDMKEYDSHLKSTNDRLDNMSKQGIKDIWGENGEEFLNSGEFDD